MKVVVFIFLLCFSILSFADDAPDIFHADPVPLMDEAKDALANNTDLPKAIEKFSEILILPKNIYTEEALELLGVAYERNKQPEIAKAKYASFLALYPESANFTRVRQRLIALEIISPEVVQQRINPAGAIAEHSSQFSAALSEYFYTSSTTNGFRQWHADQTALISNLQMSQIYRDDTFTSRSVVRYSEIKNISVGTDRNMLTQAYVDLKDTDRGYGIRIGRQSSSYGSLGRFDGVVGSYQLKKDIKLVVLLGKPYTSGVVNDRNFYGIGLDVSLDDTFSETFYISRQFAGGFLERSAVGFESHYYKNGTSLSSTMEYDTLYKSLNSIMIQGNVPINEYSLYFVIDRKKSPILLSDQALIIGTGTVYGRPFNSIQELVSKTGLSPEQVYSFVNKSSSNMSTEVVGVNKNISKSWNVGIDLQMSNLSSPSGQSLSTNIFQMPLVQPITLQTNSFNTFSIDIQAKGNDIFTKTDNVAVILSHSHSGQVTENALTYDVSKPITPKSRIDFLSRFSKTEQSMLSSITSYHGLRLSYKVAEDVNIDTQASITIVDTTDSLQNIKQRIYNKSVYFGIRVDF